MLGRSTSYHADRRRNSALIHSQVFDLPITLSLYAPYEDGGIDELLADARGLVAALVAKSVQQD